MYQKPHNWGACIVYFTKQSEMQDICKLSEESDAEKEKCQREKIFFFPLGFLEIWFSPQSEIKSLSGGNNRSWKCAVNSACNEVSMKLQNPNSASNQSLSRQSTGSSPKLWIPDFGESVFPFEHLNLRNRVRVILLRHQLPRKLKIQRRTFIHNFILLKTQIYSFGVPNLWPFLQVCPWCCQLFKPWIGYSLIWYQS